MYTPGRSSFLKASGYNELVGVHIEYLLGGDVLHRKPAALEDVPHYAVKHDPFARVAGKGLRYVEAPHASEFPFFLEEKELVRLHTELSADGAVVVDNQIVYTGLPQLFPHGQAGRARTYDRDCSLVYLPGRFFRLGRGNHPGETVDTGPVHFPDPVDGGYANAAYMPVDYHLAGAALADSAFHGTVAVLQAVVVHGEARLVESGCYCLSFLAGNGLSFKEKRMIILLRDGENRVFGNPVHWLSLSAVA